MRRFVALAVIAGLSSIGTLAVCRQAPERAPALPRRAERPRSVASHPPAAPEGVRAGRPEVPRGPSPTTGPAAGDLERRREIRCRLEAFFEKGEEAYRAGDFERAVARFGEMLEAFSRAPEGTAHENLRVRAANYARRAKVEIERARAEAERDRIEAAIRRALEAKAERHLLDAIDAFVGGDIPSAQVQARVALALEPHGFDAQRLLDHCEDALHPKVHPAYVARCREYWIEWRIEFQLPSE